MIANRRKIKADILFHITIFIYLFYIFLKEFKKKNTFTDKNEIINSVSMDLDNVKV